MIHLLNVLTIGTNMTIAHKPLHTVRRFYLLEYFYILLKSVGSYAYKTEVFEHFKALKHEHSLGESKYKTRIVEYENLSKTKENRYLFTFEQVIDEAIDYGLITKDADDYLWLTEDGVKLLGEYRTEDQTAFNLSLFRLMEGRYGAFRYLTDLLYGANKYKSGLLILPMYSPRLLNFERSSVKNTKDIIEYSRALAHKLETNIKTYLGETRDLSKENNVIVDRLISSKLLPAVQSHEFDPTKYNVITQRFRAFWLNYFLREVYNFNVSELGRFGSLSSFDIWTYRGKQIGVVYATEFYPDRDFHGRIVYPTSVLLHSASSRDFDEIYTYSDQTKLYIHRPKWDHNQDKFVDLLVAAYYDLRRDNRSYFINLLALREKVCYNMKIAEHVFEELLDKAYKLNLSGMLRIRISLEVDKSPEERNFHYQKQQPVRVAGEYRNIIAIELNKGVRPNEQSA